MLKRAIRGEVLKFIHDFKMYDHSGEVTDTFTRGYCYWFAHILHSRFPDSDIMYYAVGNHFACKIEDRIFDITGDITDKNLYFEYWDKYKNFDAEDYARVLRDCVYKTGI